MPDCADNCFILSQWQKENLVDKFQPCFEGTYEGEYEHHEQSRRNF